MTAVQIQAALLRAKLTAANRDACIKSFFSGAPAPVAPKQLASALTFAASHTTVVAADQHNQPSSQQHQQQQQQNMIQWGAAQQQAPSQQPAWQLGNGRSDFFGESSPNVPPSFYGSSPPAQPPPAYQNQFAFTQPTDQQSLTSPGAWAPLKGFEASPPVGYSSNFDDDDSDLFGAPTQTTSSFGARRNIFDDEGIDESNVGAFFQD